MSQFAVANFSQPKSESINKVFLANTIHSINSHNTREVTLRQYYTSQ